VTFGEQTGQKIGGDESCRAGDDDLHDSAASAFLSSSGVPISKKF
jgi:hypothetical protein